MSDAADAGKERLLTLYGKFFGIAHMQAKSVAELQTKCKDERSAIKDKHDLFQHDIWYDGQIENAVMSTVLFSALALEAYINFYGVQKLGEDSFSHLDRLSPKSKWLLFPKLATKKNLDKGGAVYRQLAELFNLRNDLAHKKPLVKKHGDPFKKGEILEASHARQAVECVVAVLAELKKLDDTVDTYWADTPSCEYGGYTVEKK